MTIAQPPQPKIEDFRQYLMVLARTRISATKDHRLDASDIVQETLLEAHRKQDQFRGSEPASMAAWLRQILACNVTDRLRALGRQKRDTSRDVRFDSHDLDASSNRLEQWIASQQSSPSRRLIQMENVLQVATALESLPEGQRDAIRMRYIEGLTLLDIAKRMGRTDMAVAGLLKRGLEAMRGKIDPS
jgi:RNA polymerase sigma-70 factor (ECF subfamily)